MVRQLHYRHVDFYCSHQWNTTSVHGQIKDGWGQSSNRETWRTGGDDWQKESQVCLVAICTALMRYDSVYFVCVHACMPVCVYPDCGRSFTDIYVGSIFNPGVFSDYDIAYTLHLLHSQTCQQWSLLQNSSEQSEHVGIIWWGTNQNLWNMPV